MNKLPRPILAIVFAILVGDIGVSYAQLLRLRPDSPVGALAVPYRSTTEPVFHYVPLVEHSRLLAIAGLDRAKLRKIVEIGDSPTLEEMHGLWFTYNIGKVSEHVGITNMLKDLDTLGARPIGRNYKVHQTPGLGSLVGGWQPVTDYMGASIEESSFGLIPPSGVGKYGHVVHGVYRLGLNAPDFRGERIVTRIVKFDSDHMIGQSCVHIGRHLVPAGFFAMQRVPRHLVPNAPLTNATTPSTPAR